MHSMFGHSRGHSIIANSPSFSFAQAGIGGFACAQRLSSVIRCRMFTSDSRSQTGSEESV